MAGSFLDEPSAPAANRPCGCRDWPRIGSLQLPDSPVGFLESWRGYSASDVGAPIASSYLALLI
jgi:hypothetical protein